MSEFFSRIRESSSTKVASVAAAGSVAAGCAGSGEDLPVPTETVYVTETVEVEPRDERFIDVDQPVTVAPYIVTNPVLENTLVQTREIDTAFQNANQAIVRDFDGYLDVFTLPTERFYNQPDQTETDGRPCYSRQRVGEIATELFALTSAEHGRNTLVSLVFGQTDECETVNSDGEPGSQDTAHSAAYFQHQLDGPLFTVYKSVERDDALKTFTSGREIVHETGHAAGLSHVGKFVCEFDMDPDGTVRRDLVLGDFAEVIEQKECGMVTDKDGDIDEYAGTRSVMGSGFNTVDHETPKSFSTLDKATLFPDTFRIDRISLEPWTYELELGANKRNGVAIDLPEGHPLRSIAPGYELNQLVATIEMGGIRIDELDEDDSTTTPCVETLCWVDIYAANSDREHFRVELPSTFLGILQDNGDWRKLIYLDESLGVGLVAVDTADGAVMLEVLDYQSASEFAEIQRETNERIRREAAERRVQEN